MTQSAVEFLATQVLFVTQSDGEGDGFDKFTCLRPVSFVDNEAMEAARAIKGQVRVTIKPGRLSRIGKHHRKTWIAWALIADAMTELTGDAWDAEEVLRVVKQGTKLACVVERPPALRRALAEAYGLKPDAFRYELREGSTSYAAMDQAAFSDWCERARRFVLEHMSPALEHSPRWPEIEEALR